MLLFFLAVVVHSFIWCNWNVWEWDIQIFRPGKQKDLVSSLGRVPALSFALAIGAHSSLIRTENEALVCLAISNQVWVSLLLMIFLVLCWAWSLHQSQLGSFTKCSILRELFWITNKYQSHTLRCGRETITSTQLFSQFLFFTGVFIFPFHSSITFSGLQDAHNGHLRGKHNTLCTQF